MRLANIQFSHNMTLLGPYFFAEDAFVCRAKIFKPMRGQRQQFCRGLQA